MTVVVTGASGHVGGNLVRALLARGRPVRALVRSEDPPALRRLAVEQVLGDVRDPASLRRAFDGADVVYHLAAVISISGDPTGVVEDTNVTGVRNAAAAALACGVRRMVHFCSVHAFDLSAQDKSVDETLRRVTESPERPGAYDRSKALGEAEVRRVVERGLDAVIVHPSGVLGRNDFKLSRMGSVFLRLMQRDLPALVPGGFDWVDVRDVVLGALAAEEKGRTNESYILSGHWSSIRELAGVAARVTGVAPPRFTCPLALARLAALFVRERDPTAGLEPAFTRESLAALRANRSLLHDKAAGELGYTPRPLEDTVRDVYLSFQETGRIPPGSIAS